MAPRLWYRSAPSVHSQSYTQAITRLGELRPLSRTFAFYRIRNAQLLVDVVWWVNAHAERVGPFLREVVAIGNQIDAANIECSAPGADPVSWSCAGSKAWLHENGNEQLVRSFVVSGGLDTSQLRRILAEGVEEVDIMRRFVERDGDYFGQIRMSYGLPRLDTTEIVATLTESGKRLFSPAIWHGVTTTNNEQLDERVGAHRWTRAQARSSPRKRSVVRAFPDPAALSRPTPLPSGSDPTRYAMAAPDREQCSDSL